MGGGRGESGLINVTGMAGGVHAGGQADGRPWLVLFGYRLTHVCFLDGPGRERSSGRMEVCMNES